MGKRMLLASITVKVFMEEGQVPDVVDHPLFDAVTELGGEFEGVVYDKLAEFEGVSVEVED